MITSCLQNGTSCFKQLMVLCYRCVGGASCDGAGATWPGRHAALPPAGGLWWCSHLLHLLLHLLHSQLVPAGGGGSESGAVADTQNRPWWVQHAVRSRVGVEAVDSDGRRLAAAQRPPEVRHSSVLLQPQPRGGGGGALEQCRAVAGLTGGTSPAHLVVCVTSS